MEIIRSKDGSEIAVVAATWERLLARTEFGPVFQDLGPCWLLTGAPDSHGYGVLWFRGRLHRAHRVAYFLRHGVFPSADTDHLCRRRACCNPDHLEAVTRRVNLLRGQTINAKNAAVTHCPRGHEYSSENTRFQVRGSTTVRKCRTCHRERERARRAA